MKEKVRLRYVWRQYRDRREIDGVWLEQVRVLPLGVTLDVRGTQEDDIKGKIGKAIKLYIDINSKFIKKKKIKM